MSVKENRSGRQTKEWILSTACKLFNEHGTQSISTKRIAKEMGISPGNLYYHFKNKEEIIRKIFSRSMLTFTEEWTNREIPPLQRFLGIVDQVVWAWEDCRFIKKELVILFSKDEKLKTMYRVGNDQIFADGRQLFEELIQCGNLEPPEDPDFFDSLVIITEIIAQNWLNYLDQYDMSLSEANLQQGSDLIIQVWHPYFTPEAQQELKRLRMERTKGAAASQQRDESST